MAWQDDYQQGEFRGVPFFLKGHTYGSGRDISVHKFPGRDQRYNEDTGRAERSFKLSAYVVGDDVFAQREALISALEQRGPGRLVHPYRGVFQVVVLGFSVSESSEDGRVAAFDISFTDDVPQALTVATRSTTRAVTSARANLYSAVQDDFVDKYPATFPVMAVLKTVQGAISKCTAAVDKAKTAVASVAAYRQQVERIQGKLVELSLNALDLAKEIRALVDWGADPFGKVATPTADNARQVFDDMRAVIAAMSAPWDIAPDSGGGETAQIVRDYTTACATASAVGVVASIPLSSVDEAEALRDAAFTMLDALQESPTVPDAVFDASAAAKQAIQEDIARRSLSLAVIIEYKTPESEPVLAVSQEIYGDVSRVDEIIRRNAVRHPGFCPAAAPLKIQVGA